MYEQNISFNLSTPPGLATYIHPTFTQYSTVDLMLGLGLFLSIDYVKVEHPMGINHNPILYGFKFKSNYELGQLSLLGISLI